MPGYWPSALGAATKVRIGEPGRGMSAYSVVTTICLFAGNSGGEARTSQLLFNSTWLSKIQCSIRPTGGAAPGIVYRDVIHFLSFSILSRTRNVVILRISGRGSGFSSGNWIEPLAVANFERSFAKAFTADGVG
jgi:hypothetical protein